MQVKRKCELSLRLGCLLHGVLDTGGFGGGGGGGGGGGERGG